MNSKEVLTKIKEIWRGFWFLLWKDDSFKGWLFSIIFLFLIIKFVFFPFFSFVTGTSLPLAIVESCSMYHQGNLFSDYNSWFDRHDSKYSSFNIDKNEFQEFKFKNGFNKGDILLVVGVKPEEVKIGDIIIFNALAKHPVIHRVVGITERDGVRVFETIGDNNQGQISFEKNIYESQIVGKAVFKVAPYLGWVKLVFFEPFRTDSEKGFCREN